ncbi:hypothetical protein E5D57_007413 [Metarhizium anisopliae]|nr:hypothetical protein E5D57_007413 [Metarhizium anisopliae]
MGTPHGSVWIQQREIAQVESGKAQPNLPRGADNQGRTDSGTSSGRLALLDSGDSRSYTELAPRSILAQPYPRAD